MLKHFNLILPIIFDYQKCSELNRNATKASQHIDSVTTMSLTCNLGPVWVLKTSAEITPKRSTTYSPITHFYSFLAFQVLTMASSSVSYERYIYHIIAISCSNVILLLELYIFSLSMFFFHYWGYWPTYLGSSICLDKSAIQTTQNKIRSPQSQEQPYSRLSAFTLWAIFFVLVNTWQLKTKQKKNLKNVAYLVPSSGYKSLVVLI